jgi:vitamin B12 transporter
VFNTYRDSGHLAERPDPDARNNLMLGGDWYEDRVMAAPTFTKTAAGTAPRSPSIAIRRMVLHRAGLRHDDNQQFGGQTTWSAASPCR